MRAFAADTAAVYHHLVRRGADGRFARSTEALSRLPLSVALQRGSALGVDRVQAGFAAIQPSTLREISARWLPPPASPPPWWTRWEVLIPLIALLLAGLALLVTQTWNRNLRRRVELAVVNERQAQSRLAQAERLDALGRLSAGVAHDVNNTIAIVVGTVEMLRRELSAKPDADRLAASCIDACRHAGETMRQLLRFARRGSGELVAIDLLSLIDGVIALVRPSLRGQVAISWTPPPGSWRVLADQGEIQHAIINLLLNARDAQSGRPGGITISLRQGDPLSGPPLVASAQAPPAPAIAIEVADQGCGIPPEVLPRIFEPFFTTKGVEVGTGLGLPAVEGIARRHGGAVALESTAGQGTRVVIWLPLAP